MKIISISVVLCWYTNLIGAVLVQVTSTKTEIVVETITNTLVAIGGVIQNIQVNLDNGNGHLWQYSTMLVTGERVLTIVPVVHTECATIYVYGDVTLTTETTLLTGDLKRLAKITGGVEAVNNTEHEEQKMERLKMNEIIDRMIRSAKDLNHIKASTPPTPTGDFEEVIAI